VEKAVEESCKGKWRNGGTDYRLCAAILARLMQSMSRSPENQTAHPPAEIVAGYVAHTCGQGARNAVERHCVRCSDCLLKLVVLLRLIGCAPDSAERRILDKLVPLGIEAATRARNMIGCGKQ
jgi:hypothetical protein